MRLLDKITTEDNLYAAWRLVRANRGGPGTDAVGLDEYEADLTHNLAGLRRRLRDESYLPLPLRRATLPKRDGGARELAIPAVADRVAQRAFVNVLEGVFEPTFLPCSFGYRPGLGVAQAVEAVLRHRAEGYGWVLDADVRDFFPSVSHALLMERLRAHLWDRAVLRTVGLWLEAGALAPVGAKPPSLMEAAGAQVRAAALALLGEPTPTAATGQERWLEDEGADRDVLTASDPLRRAGADLARTWGAEAARLVWDKRATLLPLLASRGVLLGGGLGAAALGGVVASRFLLPGRGPQGYGTPQGGPISPLLSNVYLHPFDQRMTAAGLRLVRYADDFVVCCASEGRARQARDAAGAELSRLRLALHADKTRVLSCDDPLHFLGHAFDGDGAYPVPPGPSIPPAVRQAGDAAKAGARAARQAGKAAAKDVQRDVQAAAKDVATRLGEIRRGHV